LVTSVCERMSILCVLNVNLYYLGTKISSLPSSHVYCVSSGHSIGELCVCEDEHFTTCIVALFDLIYIHPTLSLVPIPVQCLWNMYSPHTHKSPIQCPLHNSSRHENWSGFGTSAGGGLVQWPRRDMSITHFTISHYQFWDFSLLTSNLDTSRFQFQVFSNYRGYYYLGAPCGYSELS
jgi:hypothetical protein